MIRKSYFEEYKAILDEIEKAHRKNRLFKERVREAGDCAHEDTVILRGRFVGWGPDNKTYYETSNQCTICEEILDEITMPMEFNVLKRTSTPTR